MDASQLVQRTPDWYQFRCGKISASCVYDIIATTRSNDFTAKRNALFKRLLGERITGVPVIKRVPSLDARASMEDEAIIAYEFYYDATVEKVGSIPHPTIPNAIASPDGLIGKKGVLEIKCLDSAQHLELLETGVIAKEYEYQMHFQLACTGRAWADFVAFDPRMPEEMKLYVYRLKRDKDAIERIEQAVRDFDAEIEAKIAVLRNGNRLRAETS